MRRLFTGFDFFTGASYPFRAIRVFCGNPKLISYIIVPILLNVSIGLFLYWGLFLFGWQITQILINDLNQWSVTIMSQLPDWLDFLGYLILGVGWLLRLLLSLLLFVLTGFFLVQFGAILGAPWYGNLSEQLERLRLEKATIIEVGFVQDIWRAILFEVKKLTLGITLGLPLLIINFIPGFGTLLATVGGLTLTATLICLDFLDGPLERRRLQFRRKLKIVFESLPASAGFALVCLVLVSIPLLNLLTIPLCVASGTLFCCDRVLQNCEIGE